MRNSSYSILQSEADGKAKDMVNSYSDAYKSLKSSQELKNKFIFAPKAFAQTIILAILQMI